MHHEWQCSEIEKLARRIAQDFHSALTNGFEGPEEQWDEALERVDDFLHDFPLIGRQTAEEPKRGDSDA